ncbi:hypothetical protein Tco_1243917 [Tanacetum coccineum]
MTIGAIVTTHVNVLGAPVTKMVPNHAEKPKKGKTLRSGRLFVQHVFKFTEMQKAHHVIKARCLELEAELSNLGDDVRKDNYNELLNRFSNLEELLEYVFGTCPKVFNQQDKKHATTPRKRQVTFEDQSATSSSTTHKHVEPRYTQKSNVPVPPSTGVSSCTDASGSQPRSILKKHRIPPAKSDSLKKVEDHSRIIRSSLRTTNRVDSSISSKRTVINSHSHSVCQTCNKCLFSANHDMCVVTYLNSVNASPNVKIVVRHVKQVWKPKQVTQVWKPKHIKQIWKPTGKTRNNVGYQWRPTGRTFTLSDQCPLTRFTKLTRKSPLLVLHRNQPTLGSQFPNSPSSSVFKCRLRRLCLRDSVNLQVILRGRSPGA